MALEPETQVTCFSILLLDCRLEGEALQEAELRLREHAPGPWSSTFVLPSEEKIRPEKDKTWAQTSQLNRVAMSDLICLSFKIPIPVLG